MPSIRFQITIPFNTMVMLKLEYNYINRDNLQLSSRSTKQQFIVHFHKEISMAFFKESTLYYLYN